MSPDSRPTALRSITILAPISLGELIDRITILRIKSQHLSGPALTDVANQLSTLNATLEQVNPGIDPDLVQQLQEVNASLWDSENKIRAKEKEQDFGEGFIRLARSVYRTNDRRAAVKKQINVTYGSSFAEEKIYK